MPLPRVIRDDLSDRLIHLTRGERDQDAAETLIAILGEGRLQGGTGCIKGGFACVCFSEAPLSKLSHLLAQPSAHGVRYKPFGIMVAKAWLFARGGRPVIYQSDDEYRQLADGQKYRHVRYEPHRSDYVIDFTWEREWRIRTDELMLDPEGATVIVPTRSWEAWFQARHMAYITARALVSGGITGPSSVTRQPWHFIALDDLGVPVPSIGPPSEDGS